MRCKWEPGFVVISDKVTVLNLKKQRYFLGFLDLELVMCPQNLSMNIFEVFTYSFDFLLFFTVNIWISLLIVSL